MKREKKIIIDTDIGDDIDDAYAIALAVRLRAFDILGVTTVYRNSFQRAKIASALLKRLGRGEVSVYAGEDYPRKEQFRVEEFEEKLPDGRPVIPHYSPEFEEMPVRDGNAAAFLAEQAEKYPGETEDMNDLKGKLGSVLSLMEDAGEMHFGAGVCSLVKAPEAQPAEEKKQEKKKGEQAEKAPVREKGADAEKPVAAQAPAEAKAADAAPEKAGKPASKAEEGETAEAKPARRRGAGKQSLTAAEGAKPARRGRKPAAKAEKQEA